MQRYTMMTPNVNAIRGSPAVAAVIKAITLRAIPTTYTNRSRLSISNEEPDDSVSSVMPCSFQYSVGRCKTSSVHRQYREPASDILSGTEQGCYRYGKPTSTSHSYRRTDDETDVTRSVSVSVGLFSLYSTCSSVSSSPPRIFFRVTTPTTTATAARAPFFSFPICIVQPRRTNNLCKRIDILRTVG